MLQRSVALGIVSAGQTVAILAGSLDLSVAYVIIASSLVTAEIMDGSTRTSCRPSLPCSRSAWSSASATASSSPSCRVNAFIATLGTALILQGHHPEPLRRPRRLDPEGFEDLGYTRFGIVPRRSSCSWRSWRSSGPPALHAVRLPPLRGRRRRGGLAPLGVRTHRTIIAAHVVCSICAVITGLFLASRLGAGTPTVGTDGGYDLESIAAVVLGGTALAGGRGGVLGTIGGVFILAVLDNTFNQLEVNAFLKDVVRGVILIAAVAVYARRRRGAQGMSTADR